MANIEFPDQMLDASFEFHGDEPMKKYAFLNETEAGGGLAETDSSPKENVSRQ